MIFVFGSNEAGRHGAGAAKFARLNHGAIYGVGIGRTGQAYAIPTKDAAMRTLPLNAIKQYVQSFIKYAYQNRKLQFNVTRIGCGLAGYSDAQIAPMFKYAPSNCALPEGWRAIPNKEIVMPKVYSKRSAVPVGAVYVGRPSKFLKT